MMIVDIAAILSVVLKRRRHSSCHIFGLWKHQETSISGLSISQLLMSLLLGMFETGGRVCMLPFQHVSCSLYAVCCSLAAAHVI